MAPLPPHVPAIGWDGVRLCDGPPTLIRRPVSNDRGRPSAIGLRHVALLRDLRQAQVAAPRKIDRAFIIEAGVFEAGVPEHILWMQSGHAQNVAALRYVQLGSPALLCSSDLRDLGGLQVRPVNRLLRCSVLQGDNL